MRRFSIVVSVLALVLAGLLAAGPAVPIVSAQDATPDTAGHPLVGSWVVEETFLPQNAAPGAPAPEPRTQAVAIATFYADGNALVSFSRAGQPPLQGSWFAAGERAGTFTVVGFSFGGDGVTAAGLQRYRATVEVDATSNAFSGGYTFEQIEPDNPSGPVVFTWHAWWSGTRVDVEPPDPIALTLGPDTTSATPAAGAGTGVVTIRVFVCPADVPRTAWGSPADQAALLAACDPLESPAVAPQLLVVTDDGELREPTPGTEVDPGVYHWTDLPLGFYFVAGPEDPRLDVALFDGLRVTDEDGNALQNPGVRLDATMPEAELYYFYFFRDGS